METRFGGEARHFYAMGPTDKREVGKRGLEWNLNDWKWDGDLFIASPLNPVPSTSVSRQLFPLGVGTGVPATGNSYSSSSFSDEVNLGVEKGKRELEKRRRVVVIDDDNLNDQETGGPNLKLGGERDVGNWEGSSGKKTKLVGGGLSRAVCQVEDCGVDLSNAKDYHRRHKVCEMHSKASKALVGNVMQRFCQQCSRFHALQEFDEGKRSCRRRLAGHNKRRRKTNPDTVGNGSSMNDDQTSGYLLIRLLRILSNMHSNRSDETTDQDLLTHLLRSLASHSVEHGGRNIFGLLQEPRDLSTSFGNSEVVSTLLSNGEGPSNLKPHLTVPVSGMPQQVMRMHDANGANIQTTFSLKPSIPNNFATYSEVRESTAVQVKMNNFDLNDIYVDSDDGTEDIERSPAPVNARTSSLDCPSWVQQDSHQSSPPQTSRNSDSASAQSPSSSGGEALCRTDRIVFKLFGKEPNDFPLVLRAQILDWLSHSPTDIESYIRPGCIILTIYLHQAEAAWEELCCGLGSSLSRLLDVSEDTFWRTGWVYIRVQHQIAFVYNGQVVVDTSLPLTSNNCSKILSVKPIAIAATERTEFLIKGINLSRSKILIEMNDSGYGGGPCSAGATAVLDFMAEVLSDFITEQIKAAQVIEGILETIPLYIDAESVLVFQGLCLSRLMDFVERRLLRDDEEDEKKLDKIRWTSNLESLCWMIVDRVYMGAFPQPAGVLKTLEFLLSLLQLANKDGRIEEAAPAGKSLLSITRGSKQLDSYINSLLRNTNRMIMYCFLPSFLVTIGEDDLLSCLGSLIEPKKKLPSNSSQEDSGIDICTVLQLLVAHKRVILCPSNVDTDLNCCLCVNLVSLLRDERQNVQNMAVDIVKCLLVLRMAALEDLLVSKPNQGQHMDVLHGGFDKLLTGSLSDFFEWLQSSELMVNKVLEQCAALMWVQCIVGSAKFPGVRIKGLEGRRRREMGRRSRDILKSDQKHWEHVNERRYALEMLRDAMSTELRVVRQDKYGWVLHAESEWQTLLQQLVHERGIIPLQNSSATDDPKWQLCPIEGPYRMRKKLEHCKLRVDTVQNVLDGQFKLGEADLSKGKYEGGPGASDTESFFHLLTDGSKQNGMDGEMYGEFFEESYDMKGADSARSGWNDDQASSMNEASLHSALEFGVKSSVVSVTMSESIQEKFDIGTPIQSSSNKADGIIIMEDKSDKGLNDNGEYLIRPYLEPHEKIRFKYNCERVVGLDKHDGIFLIGELSLYIIENFYIDDSECFCEKEGEDELSVIDQALGVKKDVTGSADFQSRSTLSWSTTAKACIGGRAWAYNGGAWGKEKVCTSGNMPHHWHMWKLNSVHEILKRDYQLRPVAVEIFSMDGCNDLLVFHKKEREEVFRNLVAMNLPRNSMLDTTISGSVKQESNEGSRLFKIMAKSFSKRWQNGEISNFQYIMHLNTLAGRGYSDLTQYPVFPWVLSDYESEKLDLSDPKSFRKLEKPMGCQTREGEEEFRKRYETWDDPEVPKFHYGSHYSSAGIVLFYLLRLPPFSVENQKLQGGQFDHADRLFNSIRDTWLSASGKGNTSDVKELIPEFFYIPEFLENRFNLDLGEKQSGEKVGDVLLPPWAKGSAKEFIRKHREALESDFVSENLHHWIDLIFGYKQRGKEAEEAANVFYHYTYEGSVDIDSVTDPAMKASILAQINHFGQTPKQLFLKPHVKRRSDRRIPHPLKYSSHLVPYEIRKSSSAITQIVTVHEKILLAGTNCLLKPTTFNKYVAWGFPDRSLRFMSYDQDRLLSTHENLHGGSQIQCAGASHDGQILVTGADDGLLCVWRISKDGPRVLQHLQLENALCGHTATITCLHVSQPYMLILSGSDDCTVIVWDLSSLVFVRQLPEFPVPISAIYVNDLTGEIMTAAGILLAVWSINGDCLAVINTSQLPSDSILSVTSCTFSDWQDTNWYVTGHQSGAVKVWQMVHCSSQASASSKFTSSSTGGLNLGDKVPEYRLLLHKVLKFHKHPVTSLHLTSDLKQLLSGDSDGHL